MSLFPDLSKWWEYDKDDIMSFAYWRKDQLPPVDKEKYEKNWNRIKKKLTERYGDGGGRNEQ